MLKESEADSTVGSLNVKVNGAQAHYLRAGSGRPVVLLHGGASDSRDWVDVIANLSPYYSLYAPDMLGYGLSDRTKGSYYLSDFTNFMLGFIEVLGLDSPVLVGHSMGGKVCLEIALSYPGRISGLVLIDTSGFGEVALFGDLLLTAFGMMRRVMKRPEPYPRYLTKKNDDFNQIYLERLPNLRVPVLIVWKRCDPYFPVSLAFKAKERLPQANLVVISGYGHAPHMQDVDSFCSHLKAFLNHG